MVQIKFYGLKDQLSARQRLFSDVVHSCVVEALQLPAEKRFHRFFLLGKEDFFFPPDRSERYTILEISMFEGRSAAAKKQLIRLLFVRLHEQLGIPPQDLEITIFETPAQNWGIRGLPGDELQLNYQVNV